MSSSGVGEVTGLGSLILSCLRQAERAITLMLWDSLDLSSQGILCSDAQVKTPRCTSICRPG